MANKIQITALVQSYCGGERIIPTLESCRLQNYEYKDLIIADDASNDNGYSVALIENWLDHNRKYFTEVQFIKNPENLGIIANYRNAARRARGEIVIPLGQGDTYYSPETFALVAREIAEQRGADIADPLVWLGYYRSYHLLPKWEEESDHLQSYPFSMRLLKEEPQKATKILLAGNFIGAASFVYNKRYFDDGIFPIPDTIRDLEDYAMSVWLMLNGHYFHFLPLFVRWYEKGTGLSASRNTRYVKSLDAMYSWLEKLTEPYPELHPILCEQMKMHSIRSEPAGVCRELHKTAFRLTNTLKDPLRFLQHRAFRHQVKMFIRSQSPDIIREVDSRSGCSFAPDFFYLKSRRA